MVLWDRFGPAFSNLTCRRRTLSLPPHEARADHLARPECLPAGIPCCHCEDSSQPAAV